MTSENGLSLKLAGFVLLVLLVTAGIIMQIQNSSKLSSAKKTVPQTNSQIKGKKLTQIYCQSCHKLPSPKLLTKRTWKQVVLPRMGHRLGIYKGGERPDSLFEEGKGGNLVKAANIFPKKKMLSRRKWTQIVSYFANEAPEKLPLNHSKIKRRLNRFRLNAPSFRMDPPMTTLVKVGKDGTIYVGDAKAQTGTLTILDSQLHVKNTVVLPSAPSSMHIAGDDLYLTLMGELTPTDNPSGRIIKLFLRSDEEKYRSFVTVIDSLQRPVDATYADLTGNSQEDIVVSEFGFRTGSLSWYENVGKDQYIKHVLRDVPGAVRSVVRDFTGDGRPDIMALMAQGDEGIYLFHNEGNGAFRVKRLLRFPPSYGSTFFELNDFNDDGLTDILYTAGDNADYDPVMKPYHGIRIYLNNGANTFKEVYFYPLNGAYKAIGRDFDSDGDLDIAAISFFPDYEHSREESFVYLQNEGNFNFKAHTFQENAMGRWITLDSGDIDRDGDEDLVLGAFSSLEIGMSDVPKRLHKWWMQKGPSIVILENTVISKSNTQVNRLR